MFWLIITLIVAIIEWVAVWQGRVMLNRITKPFTLIALILWFTTLGGWQSGRIFFGLALVLSLAGDVFLLISSNRAFMAGLFSFMCAHFLYILGFYQFSTTFHWGFVILVIGIAILALVIGKLIYSGLRRRKYSRKLIIPVLIYSTVICLMLMSALSTAFKPAWPAHTALIASAGGILFTTSDSLLGYDRFVRPIKHGRFWVMLTYHLAQISLITACLLQAGKI